MFASTKPKLSNVSDIICVYSKNIKKHIKLIRQKKFVISIFI